MRLEKTRQVKTCSKNDQMMIFWPCREPAREIFMARAKKMIFFQSLGKFVVEKQSLYYIWAELS